jgi:ABC-type branched-subunit amino acid transport system substrate-binding protein
VGGDGSYSPELIQYAGPAAEGFVCTIMAVDRSTETYKDFEQRFMRAYGQSPDVYDAYAYEAGLILRQTVLNGDGDLKRYIDDTTFTSFSGPLRFKQGQVSRRYGVVKVKDGRFEPL